MGYGRGAPGDGGMAEADGLSLALGVGDKDKRVIFYEYIFEHEDGRHRTNVVNLESNANE